MGKPRKKAGKTAGQKRIHSKTVDKLRVLLAEITDLQARKTERSDELERFQERDLPEFTQWLKTNHGEKQKELTAILDETEILQASFEEAEFAYHRGRYRNEAEAVVAIEKEIRREFTALNEEMEDPESQGRPPEGVVDYLFESFLEEVKGIDLDELDKETYDRYRADFEATFDHAAEGNRAAFEKALLRLASDDSDEGQSAAKIVFRRLVRRLHPDHHPNFGEFEKSLWNEAMKCYEMFDAEGLETVELRLQIHLQEEFTPAQTPALRRYRDTLERRVEDILDCLDEARSHPAWGFSLQRKTKAFLKSMQEEFEAAVSEAALRLQGLKNLFNQAKRFAPKRKTRGAKKKPTAKKKAPKRPKLRSEEPVALQQEFPF